MHFFSYKVINSFSKNCLLLLNKFQKVWYYKIGINSLLQKCTYPCWEVFKLCFWFIFGKISIIVWDWKF